MPNLNPQQFVNHVPYESTGEHLDEQAGNREMDRLDKLPVRGNRNRPALVKAGKKYAKAVKQIEKAQNPKNKDPNRYDKGDEAYEKKDKAMKTLGLLDKKNRGY